jgi:putative methionine-R-sulfoxide reductase with GAF domain
MPARLILHPPNRASRFIVLRDGETLTVGRDPACTLVLEDPRVSERHARLTWTGTGWVLEDLKSKNGSSLNGAPPPRDGTELAHGDSLSFGGLWARFERLEARDLLTLETDRLSRLQTSADMQRRLTADLDPLDLLLRFLESVLEVAGGERGFVLVAGVDGRLRPEVALGFTAGELESDRLAGSTGAIERALTEGRSIVVCDAQRDPVLGGRESVVSQKLATLACVPLRHEQRLLGLLYVDSRQRASLTELDVQILEALADHSAALIAGIKFERQLHQTGHGGKAADPGLLEALHWRLLSLARGRLPGLLLARTDRPDPSDPV